jgi:hypothetical protein
MSKRVCIKACVQDIPGNPLARTSTLGELFCQKVLRRPFRETLDVESYDHSHIPPGFDSPNPVNVWFVFDLDVKGELDKERLDSVPHFVYLASVQNSGELCESFLKYSSFLTKFLHREFIPRDNWKEGAKKRAKMYVWGGRQEQQLVKAMRESACNTE